MSTKYNYEEPPAPGNVESIYANNWKCNTFTPGLDYDIDYIVLVGFRSGDCVSVDIDIYKADGAHKPKESSLGTAQLLQAAISATPSTEITWTFSSPVPLTNGQEYAIVVSSAGPDAGNTFYWQKQFIFSPVQGGYESNSANAGSSWTGVGNWDRMWFQVWGSAAGNDPVDTPSPANSATGQQSGSVDLSWADPNDPDFDDYDVWFGPTDSMVLVEAGYDSLSLTIADDMILGQEYTWRIDGNDGEDVIAGTEWTFTVESFDPPVMAGTTVNIRYLIVVSNNKVWYEDI